MPIKPKRILWPTDFSELSLHAGRYAHCFQKQFGSDLHIIHIVAAPLPPEMSVTLPADVPVTLPDSDLLDSAREALHTLIRKHFDDDKTIKIDAFFGGASSGICGYARDHEIDLIVVPTHGRTGLQHALIGSTAEDIVRHAPCPVLVVKSNETEFIVGEGPVNPSPDKC
ncbi:MAG: universal stress protein [Phycisphaerae bacterium]|nr:universal stress protein [Phycisphaerae bacterium]